MDKCKASSFGTVVEFDPEDCDHCACARHARRPSSATGVPSPHDERTVSSRRWRASRCADRVSGWTGRACRSGRRTSQAVWANSRTAPPEPARSNSARCGAPRGETQTARRYTTPGRSATRRRSKVQRRRAPKHRRALYLWGNPRSGGTVAAPATTKRTPAILTPCSRPSGRHATREDEARKCRLRPTQPCAHELPGVPSGWTLQVNGSRRGRLQGGDRHAVQARRDALDHRCVDRDHRAPLLQAERTVREVLGAAGAPAADLTTAHLTIMTCARFKVQGSRCRGSGAGSMIGFIVATLNLAP